MKISIILPNIPFKPTGGSRIMYEYANRLSEKGYDVHIYHAFFMKHSKIGKKLFLKTLLFIFFKSFKKDFWFDFKNNIKTTILFFPKNFLLRDADVIILTWWATALNISKLHPKKGKIFNLIQDYEIWCGSTNLVHESYGLTNTTNIIIAKYLQEIINNYTEKIPEFIPNGIDSNIFNIKFPIPNRDPFSICMMYSDEERKGAIYSLEAVSIVKTKYPQLQVIAFGKHKKSTNFPLWINYIYLPENLSDLYNSSSIFITSSLAEGWGLPACEAMLCGCALICTNVGGHLEFALHNETALLVEPKHVKQMAESIIYLIENNDLRIKLAENGNEFVQKFSWENAVEQFENLIRK